jgi:signal transduction histidine kinase/streptogramin lyase
VAIAWLVTASVEAASMLDASGRYAVSWWTVDDGLPEPPLNGLALSATGEIICASHTTLSRFDGRVFRPFPEWLIAPLREQLGAFWSIGFDGEGQLWVQGSLGAAQLSPPDQAGRQRWRVHAVPQGTVTGLCFTSRGRPVLVGPGIVLAFDGRRFVDITPIGPRRPFWRYGGIDPATDELWLWGMAEGARRLFHGRLANSSPRPLVIEEDDSWVGKGIITMAFAAEGPVALLPDAVAMLREGQWLPLPPEVPDADYRISGKLACGGDGTVWVSSHNGLFACRDGRIERATGGLPAFSFYTGQFLIDSEGTAWAACGSGLLAVRPTRLRVQPIRDCRAACERADGSLIAGIPGGIVSLPSTGSAGADSQPVMLARLPDAAVPTGILEDDQGRLWIGTRDNFVMRLSGGTIERVTGPAEHFRELRSIEGIARDTTGRIWAGTSNGLAFHDPRTDRFRPVPAHQGQPGPVVIGLVADGDGVLAATAAGGVVRFATRGGQTAILPATELPGRRAVVLRRDSRGTVWVGGEQGLVRVEPDGSTFQLSAGAGLVDESIRQIDEDSHGRLWLAGRGGSFQGIRLDDLESLAEGRLQFVRGLVHGPLDGIGDNECVGRMQRPGGVTGPAAALVVPVSDGLVGFLPERAAAAPGLPPQITVSAGATTGGRTFFFTAPGPHPFTQPLFQTRLQEVDQDWSAPAPAMQRHYASLPPGTHSFLVRRIAGENDREFPLARLSINVPAPWWRTPWAVAGLVAAAALAAWGTTRALARRRILQLERQGAMERERARIARDIHDSLGAGLTRVALMSDLARRGQRPPDDVRTRLDAIHRDARDLTRSVDEIVWAVNPRNDTAARFVSYVVHDVEQSVRAGELTLRLDVPDRLPEDLPLTAQVRHHVCLAVRELLQNVLRHAQATHIDFSIRLADDRLVVSVTDDGIGFAGAGDQDIGQDGLANVTNRVAEVGGKVTFDAPAGAGTRVEIRVPLAGRPAVAKNAGQGALTGQETS